MQTAPAPLGALRTLSKEIRSNCLRDTHQLKAELTAIEHSPTCATPETKRRLVETMIDGEVTGMESHTLFKKKDTPPRMLRFFFKKLVQKKYLSEKTTRFLKADRQEHIHSLRQLLAQHQSEFNTVIETIEANKFAAKDRKNVFLVLTHVGTFTK